MIPNEDARHVQATCTHQLVAIIVRLRGGGCAASKATGPEMVLLGNPPDPQPQQATNGTNESIVAPPPNRTLPTTEGLEGKLITLVTQALALQGCNLETAKSIRRFTRKHKKVLDREGSAVVAQLAAQEPNTSVIFQASRAQRPARTLSWRNKPQLMDDCLATFTHTDKVYAIDVSRTRIVGVTHTSVVVYDRETDELLVELPLANPQGGCVAIHEAETTSGQSLIVAGTALGDLAVWNAGKRQP
jgi:hypothetical protein